MKSNKVILIVVAFLCLLPTKNIQAQSTDSAVVYFTYISDNPNRCNFRISVANQNPFPYSRGTVKYVVYSSGRIPFRIQTVGSKIYNDETIFLNIYPKNEYYLIIDEGKVNFLSPSKDKSANMDIKSNVQYIYREDINYPIMYK